MTTKRTILLPYLPARHYTKTTAPSSHFQDGCAWLIGYNPSYAFLWRYRRCEPNCRGDRSHVFWNCKGQAPGLVENLHSDHCLHSENLKPRNSIIRCSHLNQISLTLSPQCFRHNDNETTIVIISLFSLHKQSSIGYIENTSYNFIHTIKSSPLYCKLEDINGRFRDCLHCISAGLAETALLHLKICCLVHFTNNNKLWIPLKRYRAEVKLLVTEHNCKVKKNLPAIQQLSISYASDRTEPASLPPSLNSLQQWFLTVFTYLTLLSNKITRFTPNTHNGAFCWKYEMSKLLQFRMIYKNLNRLQFMFQ